MRGKKLKIPTEFENTVKLEGKMFNKKCIVEHLKIVYVKDKIGWKMNLREQFKLRVS